MIVGHLLRRGKMTKGEPLEDLKNKTNWKPIRIVGRNHYLKLNIYRTSYDKREAPLEDLEGKNLIGGHTYIE